MRWLLGGTAAIWVIYILSLLIIEDVRHTPLRSACVACLVVLTIVTAIGVAAGELLRRVRAAVDQTVPAAVELGRRLEHLRQDGPTGKVLPIRPRRVGR